MNTADAVSLDEPRQPLADRIATVIITRNNRERLAKTLDRLVRDRSPSRTYVVDNGSTDGTAEMVRRAYPAIDLVALPGNAGAAARTAGAERAVVPYLAFCDDGSLWDDATLARAADYLDQHPRVGVINARVVVGREQQASGASDDVLCLTPEACVIRRDALLACGGFDPRFEIGGDELLLSLDLASRGWLLRQVDDIVLHRDEPPAASLDPARVLRNRLWVAWLRYRSPEAWMFTRKVLSDSVRDGNSRRALFQALAGLPWVIPERRPVNSRLQQRIDETVA